MASEPPSPKRFWRSLQAAARIALFAGAAGSLALMLRAGRHQPSLLLVVLFTIWVLSPFLALVMADSISSRRRVLAPAMLYSLMLLLTLASLAFYGLDAWRPPKAQAASVFVVVPLGSWLLIAAVVSTALFKSKLPPPTEE